MRALLDDLLATLLPGRCPGCGARAEPVCPACAATMRSAPGGPAPAPLLAWRAAWVYEGVARELVARLKYRNTRHVVPFVADAMVAALGRRRDDVGVVVPVPTTASRARARGFDHADLLATAIARRIGRPVSPVLRRGAGPPQTGLPAAQRWRGPSFRVTHPLGATVRALLVDDIATTGATLAAAARALVDAGAAPPIAVVAARTPWRPRRP